MWVIFLVHNFSVAGNVKPRVNPPLGINILSDPSVLLGLGSFRCPLPVDTQFTVATAGDLEGHGNSTASPDLGGS